MPIPGYQLVAGGDINVCRFVNLDTSANNTVLEADAGEKTIGISQEGSADTPLPGASTLAAAAADPIHIYTFGEVALLCIGSGGCTAGDWLKSDADGKGVTASSDKEWAGAIALETASASELARVLIYGTYLGV